MQKEMGVKYFSKDGGTYPGVGIEIPEIIEGLEWITPELLAEHDLYFIGLSNDMGSLAFAMRHEENEDDSIGLLVSTGGDDPTSLATVTITESFVNFTEQQKALLWGFLIHHLPGRNFLAVAVGLTKKDSKIELNETSRLFGKICNEENAKDSKLYNSLIPLAPAES